MEFYEKELLKGLAQNDRKAIEIIYTNHYPIIQALIISNNGTYDDAKDIFQEGMIIQMCIRDSIYQTIIPSGVEGELKKFVKLKYILYFHTQNIFCWSIYK